MRALFHTLLALFAHLLLNVLVPAEAPAQTAAPNPEAPMPIRFSVMIEAPLTGKGAVSFTAKRMHNADVELTLGANAFVAQGALGGPNDKLAVRVDAPRLAVLDKSLQGRARQLRAAPRTSCGSNSP